MKGGDYLTKFFHIHRKEGIKSKYDLIVFDDNKEVFFPLTDYYHYQIKRMSEGSVVTYLNILEVFFYWIKNTVTYQGRVIAWDDTPQAIHEAIRVYLMNALNCKIRDKDSFESIYVTSGSNKSVQIVISALKSFYHFASKTKIYNFNNPLVGTRLNKDYLDFQGVRLNKPRLSALAGTEEPIVARRYTDTYFKIVNNQWTPEIIGDFDLPFRIYKAGEEVAWSLRDEIIIRMLFETGARISEVLELTVGDYKHRRDIYEFSAINKGSFNKRIKFIRISPETLKLLMRYINSTRNMYLMNAANSDLEDNEFIFLNKFGNQYTYNAFYQAWSKITSKANLKLNPHKTRHWFVTSMMKEIYETSQDAAEIERRKKQLIAYMKWRDPNTINVYEHYNDENKFRVLHESLQASFAKREQEYKNASKSKKVTPNLNLAKKKNDTIPDNNWLDD